MSEAKQILVSFKEGVSVEYADMLAKAIANFNGVVGADVVAVDSVFDEITARRQVASQVREEFWAVYDKLNRIP